MKYSETNFDLAEIDNQNKKCYDAIGNEYGDVNHKTCRDFDTGSRLFIEKMISQFPLRETKKGFNYLDIGTGTGVSLDAILPWLKEKNATVDVLDISEKMIEVLKEKYKEEVDNYFLKSIHNFYSSKKYDLIVATLCDPYLTTTAIEKIKKILSKDGILIITLPTNTWARKIRKDAIYKTTFHDNNRTKHVSFSFCWNKSDLIKVFESSGLYMIYSSVFLLEDIEKHKEISDLNKTLLLEESKVPLLLSLSFVNR